MTRFCPCLQLAFRRSIPHKKAGPGNITDCVPKDCAEDLRDVLTDVFNISLSQAFVPNCFKSTNKEGLSILLWRLPPCGIDPHYHKVLCTVVQYIKSALPCSTDPYQFAYQANRSSQDGIPTGILNGDSALTHLDSKHSYLKMYFLDFSSTFNTKLNSWGMKTSRCNLLLDFLARRPRSRSLRHSEHGGTSKMPTEPPTFTCTPTYNSNLWQHQMQ